MGTRNQSSTRIRPHTSANPLWRLTIWGNCGSPPPVALAFGIWMVASRCSPASKNLLGFATLALGQSAPSSRTSIPGQFCSNKPCGGKCPRAQDELEAHRDGQGRTRDFGVRLCASRIRQVHGPSLREDGRCCQTKSPQRLVVVASVHEQPVPIFQQLARGHPSGRDDVRSIRCRCATSRIFWPSVGSTSATRPSGFCGTGSGRFRRRDPQETRRAHARLSSVALMEWMPPPDGIAMCHGGDVCRIPRNGEGIHERS